MKILITGGAGFVGSQLAHYLRRRGNDIVCMDNLVRRGTEINLGPFKEAGIEFVHGDVRNREDFANLPSGIDAILEASAQPSATMGYANPLFDVTNNTLGLIHVLEHARAKNLGVVFWSTNKVYSGDKVNTFARKEEATRWVWDQAAIHDAYPSGLPPGFDPRHGISESFTVDGGQHSIYGLSKIMADLACQEYADAFDVPVVVNRCSCLAGEGQFGKSEQGWVAWWAIAHKFGLPLQYIGWKGKQVRDVLFVEDLARLVELELKSLDKVKGRVFTVGGGHGTTLSLREATALVEKKMGTTTRVLEIEAPRKADHCIYISDIRNVQRELGWTPRVGIDQGYDRILKWVEEHERELKRLYVS